MTVRFARLTFALELGTGPVAVGIIRDNGGRRLEWHARGETVEL